MSLLCGCSPDEQKDTVFGKLDADNVFDNLDADTIPDNLDADNRYGGDSDSSSSGQHLLQCQQIYSCNLMSVYSFTCYSSLFALQFGTFCNEHAGPTASQDGAQAPTLNTTRANVADPIATADFSDKDLDADFSIAPHGVCATPFTLSDILR